jgi:preprotein translocase subunit SecD
MMKSPLSWKLALIVLVIGLAAFFSFPPSERINLGLDLRGGAHILMQVKTESALKYQLDLTQNQIGQQLKERGLSYASITPADRVTLELRGTDPARRAEVREVLQTVIADWQVAAVGDGDWRASMPPQQQTYYETTAVDTTLTTLRNRIDALGVAEPLVQKQGIKGDRILIQLPGVDDPERVKDVLKDPALLEWKAVTYPPGVDPGSWIPPDSREGVIAQYGGRLPEDTELFPQHFAGDAGATVTVWWPLKRVSTVSGSDLRTAYRSSDEWGDAAVSFQLTQEAGKRFEAATRENVGRKMAIVLGGVESKEVVSAPVIRDVIRDQGIISGGFSTVQEAEDLALKLRSGAIPTEVQIIEERTVGPSLGQDSIRAGLIAGVAGFIGVMLFMVAYYRAAGINAVVALGLNVLLVLGALGALPFLFSGVSNLRATLTLPGIAGLILTVGMAVDTNVLIFERVREELRLGKTVRAAVDQGFSKAFMTILDCHVTTIVSAVFLGLYGTGPVRGFAVTLIIGLVASMFTGVFVSRQLFELVLSRTPRAESLSI